MHFFIENGKLCPDGAYFFLYVVEENILLEPEYVPGEWVFRCPFGYHYSYKFYDPEAFFLSLGDRPYEIDVQCFNAGENRIPEHGGGDDIPSDIISWQIVN